jgi:hypothetical protein
VDQVLEGPGGRVVGVEVKSSSAVVSDDFRHLRTFAASSGALFRRGVVLYAGERVIPFGENLLAIPLSALWA